jgi:phage major head subunit gpT-like protein
MLHHKNIGLKYWVEAINITTYLRAKCLHKTVEGMMSKEGWSRKKLTTNHLRIFGCETYYFIPNKMKTKL